MSDSRTAARSAAPTRGNRPSHWTAERIRALRGDRTQAKFAEALGVARPTISHWERGRSPVPLAAHALDAEAKRQRAPGHILDIEA